MTDNNSSIIQLAAGKLIDKYTVVKKLGEGSFGAVYKVEGPSGKQYALKAESVNEKIPVSYHCFRPDKITNSLENASVEVPSAR
ncbi:hypothetical protein COOONC_14082 [Cooperia oncophora]